MKLVRFGQSGREKPGIIDRDGKIRDLSSVVDDINPSTVTPAGLAKIKKVRIDRLKVVTGKPRLGACIGGTRHFIAIGFNYSDHAKETGTPLPKEPLIFEKAPSCISGPDDKIIVPKGSTKLDWEVELCVVIGRRAQYLTKKNAMSAVAGYCLCNDVSERHFQFERHGQYTKGKSAESFGPIGPWLVTKDEIADVQRLPVWLDVNGRRMQNSTTKTMIFDVAHIVWYCSQFFILEPGDLIATGTPPGVGLGIKPKPKFLKPGDEVRLGIQGLGEQRHIVVPARR